MTCRNHSPRRNCAHLSRILIIAAIFCFPALFTRAQNTLDKAGLGAGVTASVAYSTRLLSTGYAGKALQVRRSSDNTTQDIGFTAAGDLDSAALKTFVGAGNGMVSLWYDQSGHALNLTQATAANQPVLVSSGAINRENAQPFIRFFGSGSAFNSLNLATTMTTVGHVSAVMRLMSAGDGFILSYTGGYDFHSNPPSFLFSSTFATGSVQGGAAWFDGTAYTPTLTPWPSILTNAELEPSTPGTGTTWDNLGSDRNLFHDISLGGGYGEVLVFPTALSSANRLALETNQTGFFTIYSLPVTWLSFTGQLREGKVFLQWQTAGEQNSKDYTVQYGSDGKAWTALAIVPAAGNSKSTLTYDYVHDNPQPGDNYYRLQQTDLDGKIHYSTVVQISIAGRQTEFQVLQNPVIGGRLVVLVNSPTTLGLYSPDGKLLWWGQFGAGTQEIPLGNYTKGSYFLAGKSTTVKILLP